jgi:SAM-dependent methyltransferase
MAGGPGTPGLELFAEAVRFNRWMFSKLAPHIGGDVLEIGSGIGNLSGLIVGAARSAVLTDAEPRYLAALARTFAGRADVAVLRWDLDGPPPQQIAGRRFDTIVGVNVIEHVQDDQALATRLAALLKPAGKLVVYVPACPFAYGSLDRALGHRRRYTPGQLDALLAGAGLAAQPATYMNFLGLVGWLVNGRVLRARRLSRLQIALFDRLMPLLALEDRVRLPLGLGLHAVGTKRG